MGASRGRPALDPAVPVPRPSARIEVCVPKEDHPRKVSQFHPNGGNVVQIRHAGAMSNGVPHLHYEQAHDDNGDGFVNWGTVTSERKPVVWNGVTVDPAPAGTDGCATSANCGTPDQVGMFRGSDPPTMFLDNNHDGSSDIKIYWGGGGDQPLSGDWDGNGSHGVGVFRPDNGYVYLDDNLDGVAAETFRYGAAGDRPFSRKRG